MTVFAILTFIARTTVGRISAAAVVALTAFLANNAYQRNVGRQDVVAKIEKKVKANEKMVDAVRRKSGSGAAGGLLDPYNANSK